MIVSLSILKRLFAESPRSHRRELLWHGIQDLCDRVLLGIIVEHLRWGEKGAL